MRPSQTELWLGLTLTLALLAVRWASAQAPIYVSSWAVRVTKGYQEAERLARKFGFVNLGQVGGTWGVGLDNLRSGQMGGCPQDLPKYVSVCPSMFNLGFCGCHMDPWLRCIKSWRSYQRSRVPAMPLLSIAFPDLP